MPPAQTRERILDAAQHLVVAQGFGSTTVDAVLAAAGASKGAFFHHFPSKGHLGRALVERYAARDAEVLDTFMTAAEKESDDPAAQLIAFVRAFEEAADDILAVQPSCLFVSFIYEAELTEADTREIVVRSILHWRERILEKLAAVPRPASSEVDLPSLADQVFTTFEGAFLLARALNDPTRMRCQLAHLRHYLELLFERA
jgi:TetR/AcrR family transcriptional regulator, transcriptional repressor for nem operon